jgi:hypothetical protein
MRIDKTRVLVLSLTFFIGFFYQPILIYQNFYFNPRWVDEAWWSLNYPAYLIAYSVISTGFVELAIRFLKKYS